MFETKCLLNVLENTAHKMVHLNIIEKSSKVAFKWISDLPVQALAYLPVRWKDKKIRVTWGGATSTSSRTRGLLGSYATAAALITYMNIRNSSHSCFCFFFFFFWVPLQFIRKSLWNSGSQKMGDKKIPTNLRNSQLKEGKNKIVHKNGNKLLFSRICSWCYMSTVKWFKLWGKKRKKQGKSFSLSFFLTFADDGLPFCCWPHRSYPKSSSKQSSDPTASHWGL